MNTIAILTPVLGQRGTCRHLGVPRHLARSRKSGRPRPPAHRPACAQKRALTAEERRAVLELLGGEGFADVTPYQVVAKLLEGGRYVCSVRTMYRILAENGAVCERRNQLRHPKRPAPRLRAWRPNQVWCWDITALPSATPVYLYTIIDLYSRYVVGWMIDNQQSDALAVCLVETTCRRQQIQPGQLSVHADNGSPMSGRGLYTLYTRLGITPSHSRPHVSDDNPFIEVVFKTGKYHASYPGYFADLHAARRWAAGFFDGYNEHFYHSALAYFTPADVFFARVDQRLPVRQAALDAAFQAHPERFVRGRPLAKRPPAEVVLNRHLVEPIPLVSEPTPYAHQEVLASQSN
jgi:putative transposase